MNVRPQVILGLALVCLWPALATAEDDTPTHIADLTVTASAVDWQDGEVSEGRTRRYSGWNLAEALDGLPGVWAVRRSASGAEPVIRGLGWERVRTTLGAVPLYGACPGRMDPPATYLSAANAGQISLFRQGGGAGPGGTGGAIHADPDFERPADAAPGLTVFGDVGYESARNGTAFLVGAEGGSDRLDTRATLGGRQTYDYEAPDGTGVPSEMTNLSTGLSLGWRPTDTSRLWTAGSYVREDDVDFPAMPMDNIETDFWALNAGWRADYAGRTLRQARITAGFSGVNHFMDNSRKSTRARMKNETNAETRTTGVVADVLLVPGDRTEIRTGVDATGLKRDALRSRQVVATGQTFWDRLWPDARQTTLSPFARLTRALGETTRLSLDGRLDLYASEARAADAASLGGLTVREQYVRFYGDEAAETDRDETLGSLALKLERPFGERTSAHVRVGYSSRAAGVTERYYAFGPAPGGFQIGNPTLQAEKKWEGEAGLVRSCERMTLVANLWYAGLTDFILPTVVARMDVNGDGNPDNIKGFLNVDAALYGGELGLEYRATPRWVLPLTLSYVRGRNTTDDRNLPEMPPLTGTLDVRWLAHEGTRTWLTAGCYAAWDQDKIDPLFPEDTTPGYVIYHLRAEGALSENLSVLAEVDNLFDRLYTDHLTREALTATASLTPGQEIPMPGRSLILRARWSF